MPKAVPHGAVYLFLCEAEHLRISIRLNYELVTEPLKANSLAVLLRRGVIVPHFVPPKSVALAVIGASRAPGLVPPAPPAAPAAAAARDLAPAAALATAGSAMVGGAAIGGGTGIGGGVGVDGARKPMILPACDKVT